MTEQSHIFEPLPGHYSRSRVWEEHGETDLNLAMLENLRNELLWAKYGDNTVDGLYSVARNFGDTVLYASDQTHQVAMLLDISRRDALPEKFDHNVEAEADEPVIGQHFEATRALRLSLEKLPKNANAMVDYFESIGEPLKQPSDAYLSMYLGVAAHEAGHAILSGISKVEREVMGRDPIDWSHRLATRTYLGAHPEKALTGNWETDVLIHEERFAEGYSQLVVEKVLTALGYEPDHIAKIINYQGAGFTWETVQEGEHQLDHLDKVSAGMNIGQIMLGVLQDNQKLRKTHQGYLGDLGYSIPLTTEELVEQLKGISELTKDHQFDQSNPVSDIDWEEKVKAQQSPETKATIEALQQRRADHIKTQKEIARQQQRQQRRRLIGRASLKGLIARHSKKAA